MLFKEFLTWTFWGQDIGPGWIKNCRNGCFHTSHLTINPVFPKTKSSTVNSLLYAYLYRSKAADCLLYASFFTYLLRWGLSHHFREFQLFLGTFSLKVICFILYYSNTLRRGKSNWVWAHAVFGLNKFLCWKW